MKKSCLILLFTLVAMFFVFADEYVVSSYSYIVPEIWSRETVNIRYNDEEDVFMFEVSDYYSAKVLMFTKEDLESMQTTVQKALEWQKIAIENKAPVTKEIPNSELYMIIAEITDSATYVGGRRVPINFYFSSTVDEDTGNVDITGIMIKSGSTTDIMNEYIDIDFPTQLIVDENVQNFADAISEETIQKAIEKHNNNVKIGDDLFK